MPMIKLQSSDGEVFQVDFEIAKASMAIKTTVEYLGLEEIVWLSKVNGTILKKVIQWATYHKDESPPAEDNEGREKRTDDNICSWDADFLKVDQVTLFEILFAATNLDIKGLINLTSKAVANVIKGKTPEEIRKTFNIENDFTAAEEAQLRKRCGWCEEK